MGFYVCDPETFSHGRVNLYGHIHSRIKITYLLIYSDVNKATTPKAKATYLKAKNTTTFPQHLYGTINVLRSNLQSSLEISQRSISISS